MLQRTESSRCSDPAGGSSPCWNEFTPRRRAMSEKDIPRILKRINNARAHCHVFFPWYNTEHHHAGVGLLTSFDVAAWRLGHEVSPVPGGERRGRAFLRGLWRPV